MQWHVVSVPAALWLFASSLQRAASYIEREVARLRPSSAELIIRLTALNSNKEPKGARSARCSRHINQNQPKFRLGWVAAATVLRLTANGLQRHGRSVLVKLRQIAPK